MKVELIAHTVPTMSWQMIEPQWKPGVGAAGIDRLAEFSGRACYQSWNNPSGRDNASYLSNILEQGHFSVLEHGSATFYVQGVSRALTHELIRHRHLSYSQLSQRFVDESEPEWVIPPALEPFLGEEMHEVSMFDQAQTWEEEFIDHMNYYVLPLYQKIVDLLQSKGATRKQAREAARAVLPNMTETKIVVSGNMRAWRDFLAKRYSKHADAEICLFAGKVLDHLKGIAPNSFQDFGSEPAE